MSGSARCLFKLNLGMFGKNISRHIFLNQTRTLFSEPSLGLTAFSATRKHYKNQFVNLEESFRSKMKNYVDNDPSGMIFTEDLKVMLHLAEKTPEDIDLMTKMLKKFNGQSSEMRFGNYNFGPVVMRSMHRLNEPDVALELFQDPALSTLFYQLSSYQVFMDLLYINGKYKEMRDVYDVIRERMTDGRVHPRNTLILVTAACYKENTEESMKYALALWQDLQRRGYASSRRVLEHLSALAIRQGQPHVALEILTMATKPRYIAIRCLKIMAFADLDRVDDAIPFFRWSLESDSPNQRKDTYFKDTIEKVDAAIERCNIAPDSEIVRLVKSIKSNDMVQPETIDDHINEEVTSLPMESHPNRDLAHAPRSNRPYLENSTRVVRRPGLRDLV